MTSAVATSLTVAATVPSLPSVLPPLSGALMARPLFLVAWFYFVVLCVFYLIATLLSQLTIRVSWESIVALMQKTHKTMKQTVAIWTLIFAVRPIKS